MDLCSKLKRLLASDIFQLPFCPIHQIICPYFHLEVVIALSECHVEKERNLLKKNKWRGTKITWAVLTTV